MYAIDGGRELRMIPFQVALERTLAGFTNVAAFMQLHWSWPLVESAHFIGLTLLLGAIAAWDLRLLGFLKNVPAAAFHKLVPFAVVGFAINISSGSLFLMTHPDQYVYNPAFHLKVLCLLLAGVNVVCFYLLMFGRVAGAPPGASMPVLARVSGAVSLALWMTVIVCGRMITFFRPHVCDVGEAVGLLAECIVR
jgi:hypothetical protein